jgi:transposase
VTKRKYTKIKEIEPEIIAMREAGKTRREIAEHFGLEKQQIVWWVSRYNKAQAKLAAGIMPRPKGRPRKDAPPRDVVAEQAYEINRLKMENRLLRDFLQLTGRK